MDRLTQAKGKKAWLYLSRQSLSIQTLMTILVMSVVLVAILAGGFFLVENFSWTLEREIGGRAMAIARTLAQLEEIQLNVGKPGGEKIIQPIAERTRLATNVEYIVVMDMNQVRYSHPLKEYIGQKFSGSDARRALANHEYLSRAEGELGPSIRAFVPIKTDQGTRQVGVVAVGILTPTLAELLHGIRRELYLSLLAGSLVGILGAVLLARRLRHVMFNMEPREIARLLEERTAVFQAVGEGIIAIDRQQRITIINDEAKRLIGIEGDVTGELINEVLPDTRLPEVLETGQAQLNQERTFANRSPILTNRLPVRVKGEIVGAVSTFRDLTEVQQMAEELTGVKKYIEALRAQNHEHLNKLHTIAGLIQLGRYQEAIDYIFQVSEEQEELTQFLNQSIKDYGIAGILLGKYNRARELKANLVIDRRSRLHTLPPGTVSSSLAIILGNLLDNALEAVATMPAHSCRQVTCGIYEDNVGRKECGTNSSEEVAFTIVVQDTGPGIPLPLQEKIFEPGFTTKGSVNRGLGLAFVKKHVENLGGWLKIMSGKEGTCFTVHLPYLRQEHEKNA